MGWKPPRCAGEASPYARLSGHTVSSPVGPARETGLRRAIRGGRPEGTALEHVPFCFRRAHARPAPPLCYRPRSEEHTSELQSRVDLVCRLLLEKKKERTNVSTAL